MVPSGGTLENAAVLGMVIIVHAHGRFGALRLGDQVHVGHGVAAGWDRHDWSMECKSRLIFWSMLLL